MQGDGEFSAKRRLAAEVGGRRSAVGGGISLRHWCRVELHSPSGDDDRPVGGSSDEQGDSVVAGNLQLAAELAGMDVDAAFFNLELSDSPARPANF
jgi:hypothetical protein